MECFGFRMSACVQLLEAARFCSVCPVRAMLGRKGCQRYATAVHKYPSPGAVGGHLPDGSQNSPANLHSSLKNLQLQTVWIRIKNNWLVSCEYAADLKWHGNSRFSQNDLDSAFWLPGLYWKAISYLCGCSATGTVSQPSSTAHRGYACGKGRFLSPQNPMMSEPIVLAWRTEDSAKSLYTVSSVLFSGLLLENL